MKLIDKDALVAEIERRKRHYENIQIIKPVYESNIEDFNELLSFLNTLEVKEVDLEEELKHYCNDYYNCAYPKQLEEETCSEVMPHIVSAAKHFFELGLRSTITEEDCKLIWNIGDEIPNMSEEEFFKELLRRFKAQKGEGNEQD